MQSKQNLSHQVGEALAQHGLVLTTAESCTGGGVATAITDIAGSSAWFDRAFVTYSNEAKIEMLGVSADTLDQYGAVSEPTVREMAQGALAHSRADIAIAISGIAGPGGGTQEKPVGTVCFAWCDRHSWQKIETRHFNGNRDAVRSAAVETALEVLYKELQQREKSRS